MEILLNDFKRQWSVVGPAVHEAVEAVGSKGWYVLGSEVDELENRLPPFFGGGFASGCASGLDALELAMRALGIRPGEKVLTTPLSAFATTLAVLRVGAIPVFVDVDQYGLIDLDRVEQTLKADETMRWLLPVHLFGHCLDLQRLDSIKSKYGVKIVEDCAQSIGATSVSQPAGQVGDAAATSFYPTKNLGCLGDGGAVISRSHQVIETVKSLRDYGQQSKYEHSLIGMNSRLDEIQAAILNRAMLPSLKSWTEKRREVAEIYFRQIRNENIELLPAPPQSQSVWHLFPVLLNPAKRSSLQQYLKKQKISSGIHYPKIIPHQLAMRDVESICLDRLENAIRLAEGELSIPIHPFLSDAEIERVVQVCNEWKYVDER